MQTRRDFNKQLLGSLVAIGLVETLFTKNLLADSVKPVIGKWVNELYQLCQDVKAAKIKDIDWQNKLEELYKQCDLPEMLKLIDFDNLVAKTKLPDNGAASLGVDFAKVEGLPKFSLGKQVFALKKGRSIVPHGHDNMCTGFIVLKGDFTGKHYDRVEDNSDHYMMKPTIDRLFKPGECSTISDHKDNVHWFKCDSETGFIFNVHVIGYNPENKKNGGRVYVDPDGEKTASGLIKAKKMTSSECHKKYG
jgi:hypothetical protein